MKSHLPTEVGLATYTLKIRPILEYATPVWRSLSGYQQNEVEKVQGRSLRIFGLNSDFLPSLLETRRDKASSREFEKICKNPEHPCLKLLPDNVMNSYYLRRDPSTKYFLVQNGIKTHLYLVVLNNSNFLINCDNVSILS